MDKTFICPRCHVPMGVYKAKHKVVSDRPTMVRIRRCPECRSDTTTYETEVVSDPLVQYALVASNHQKVVSDPKAPVAKRPYTGEGFGWGYDADGKAYETDVIT